MRTLIAIPSKARTEILSKYALKWLSLLPPETPWMVFVEPQDYEEYNKILPQERLWRLPDNNQGLSYSKGIIKQYAQEHALDFVFKVDDDIRAFTDFRNKSTVEETAKRVEELIKEFEQFMVDHPRVGAIGFPYRNELYTEGPKYEKTKRLQTCYFIRTELVYSNPKQKTFEDFGNSLYVMTKGYLILRWYHVAIDMGVAVGKGTGGIQSFDRAALAMDSLAELRKIYPPLAFRKVDKPWKLEPDMRSVKLGWG